jgi:hypothetical protein
VDSPKITSNLGNVFSLIARLHGLDWAGGVVHYEWLDGIFLSVCVVEWFVSHFFRWLASLALRSTIGRVSPVESGLTNRNGTDGCSRAFPGSLLELLDGIAPGSENQGVARR